MTENQVQNINEDHNIIMSYSGKFVEFFKKIINSSVLGSSIVFISVYTVSFMISFIMYIAVLLGVFPFIYNTANTTLYAIHKDYCNAIIGVGIIGTILTLSRIFIQRKYKTFKMQMAFEILTLILFVSLFTLGIFHVIFIGNYQLPTNSNYSLIIIQIIILLLYTCSTFVLVFYLVCDIKDKIKEIKINKFNEQSNESENSDSLELPDLPNENKENKQNDEKQNEEV